MRGKKKMTLLKYNIKRNITYVYIYDIISYLHIDVSIQYGLISKPSQSPGIQYGEPLGDLPDLTNRASIERKLTAT